MKPLHPFKIFSEKLLLIIMIYLYGWNSWNGDRDAYENYYNSILLLDWGIEVGYACINFLAKTYELDYQELQIIISIITLIMIFRYFSKTTKPSFTFFFLLSYFFLFFPLDYVLIRSTLAFSIILQGFLILEQTTKYRELKYIIIILIAASIHKSMILFLVFVFANSDRLYPPQRFFLLLLFFCLSGIFLLQIFAPPYKVQQHLSVYKTSLNGGILNTLTHLFSTLGVFLLVFMKKNGKFFLRKESLKLKKDIFIINVNLFSLFFIPFYFYSEIFLRSLRYVIFFNIFYYANSIFEKKYLPHLAFSFLLFLIFSIYLIFTFLLPVINLTVIPLFLENPLFK